MGKPPKWQGTSTYDPDSAQAKLGREAENEVVQTINELGKFTAVRTDDMMDYVGVETEMPRADVAIANSQNGDVVVLDRVTGRQLFTVEVKSSDRYDNAAITFSELRDSKAKYLVMVGRSGMWCALMTEALKVAFETSNHSGSFWLVPYNKVKRIKMEEME